MKISIATHGSLSEGFLDTLNLIIGEETTKDIQIYSLFKGDSPINLVEKFKRNSSKDEVNIIFTDIGGGSVYNAFSQLTDSYNIYVVSGTNIPILLDFLLSSETDIEKRLNSAVNSGITGISFVKDLEVEIGDEDF